MVYRRPADRRDSVMIYVTGDTHGNQYRWAKQIAPALSMGDILIVCGDFGVGFWNGRYWSEETFYDYLAEQNYTVLFADGNHENFDKLSCYPVEYWCGGSAHKIRNNVIHLMRGEIYNIEGNSVFVMGGGYPIDKALRTEGTSWWPQEMPSEEEYRSARENLKRAGHRVDYIITHTAPAETISYLSEKENSVTPGVEEERALTVFLDEVQKSVSYKHWYFGHLHVDSELRKNQTALFHAIRELQSGKIVR